ncbi:hypothetical protein FA95DRAFT_967965 [Auriscalpium vulgare]|uniref:Uncharacterized protein n=1 Tax=Auriscalpium vulgare TaxID=40419 RepID=A0ACB8R7L6_9AGAM|nr:hypothetical protein FA95DRAFT_967965 [Auriscalpium vulgare]
MTNWNSPLGIAYMDAVLIKLVHFMWGVAIWEIVTTGGFEWAVIVGNRPYRWTIWVYTGCRVSMLAALTVFLASKDFAGLGHCTAWAAWVYALGYISLGLGSLLMLLRISAIWSRNFLVLTISGLAWLTGIALNIRYLIIVSAVYNPLAHECIPAHSDKSVVSVIGIVVADFKLLGFMILGIMRLRVAGGTGGLWGLLWNQGLVWLTLAISCELPALVVVRMNLNVAWNVVRRLLQS